MANKELLEETEVLVLMSELNIESCCVAYTICTNGPNGPKVLSKDLMIGVDPDHGALCFLGVQEFSWTDRKKIQRLKELLQV